VQLRHYVELQEELAINYCKLAVVSVDPPEVNDAFRTGLGANFPFLSDQDRKVVQQLDMDELRKDLREMMKKVRPDFDPQARRE
jgi:peroxiredoxin